jgi:hypothetical protein
MKAIHIKLLLVAEITVPDGCEDPVAAAQDRLDQFRELAQPNHYGISLFRITPADTYDHVSGNGTSVIGNPEE